ncbi:FGGY-family carbohydrate kinase [Megamonas hypermegale]|uniref:FGGY-family carbohydrate kinase n=1 Tax=Megamonas hypermegale TaxID=158847 RepID=UPI0025A43C1E|nr:FGGY-family carbohydrate kinase [Megamonas hypermegale]MDM8143591.1 FGGY-family carbohydrate kinase [Megamonas hypermegale]
MAKYYAKVVKEIEEVTRREYKHIHIIGGGCQDVFLNRLTAKYTGKDIYVGPIEATAVGNIVCQMRKANEFPDLIEARKCIAKSFDVHKTEIIEGRFWEYAND